MKLGCIREIFKIKKCKSILLLQVSEKAVLMLLCNIIRKTVNWQRRIEKEITLLKFRDTDPKLIVDIKKHNPNLVMASKENVQIFMLVSISRSNAKNVAKKWSITHM